VKRRVTSVKKAHADGVDITRGDRVLVVGYDVDEEKFDYHDLPDDYLLKPGMSVSTINGVDHSGRFEAFIHAPFKDDAAGARNDTSLSLQITLTHDGSAVQAKVLLFGDLAYDTIMKIFKYSEAHDRDEYLEWDLLLAPHHCSKKVMYIVEDGQEVLKTDILESFEKHAREGAVIVASSAAIPTSDKSARTHLTRRRLIVIRSTRTDSSARWSGPVLKTRRQLCSASMLLVFGFLMTRPLRLMVWRFRSRTAPYDDCPKSPPWQPLPAVSRRVPSLSVRRLE